MKVSELKKMADRYWKQDYREDMSVLGQAKFITGHARNDLFFHHMLIKHGVELIFKEEIQVVSNNKQWRLVDYSVTDEKQFLMFCLRWS